VTLAQAALAVPAALRILRKRRAQVVVGAGGYVAGPVGLAAWLTRRPLLITEADSRLGITNRFLAPLARRVALAFPIPGRRGRRYTVTGRPVSEAVRAATRTGGRRAFGIAPEETVVLVVGGSQGAQSLNRAAIGAFGDSPPFTVIHSCGAANYEEAAADLARLDPGSRYRLEPYLENLPDAIAAADLVVSRAGGSVFEIAAIGRPAILVPYPHATGDHQAKNARWLAEAGAAVSLPDYACTPEKLRGVVGALLADPRRLEGMAESARAIGRPEAADVIAEAVLELAR
jgi:UDP-N-acetylglucosamine--N-acetylmuramyl-(pentapeptide) pyrophosphoryl-undecaprenol N-acetylglucosamine transferase